MASFSPADKIIIMGQIEAIFEYMNTSSHTFQENPPIPSCSCAKINGETPLIYSGCRVVVGSNQANHNEGIFFEKSA